MFNPIQSGRYIVSLVAYAQVTMPLIVKLKLMSDVDIQKFGTGQIVTEDGDMVGSTGMVGLIDTSPYYITASILPLQPGSPTTFETQRLTINMYISVI
jgi:hypothetical protein